MKAQNRAIWKYQLKLVDRQDVDIPEDADILTAQMQGNVLCLWAKVDTTAPLEIRTIAIFGTGQPGVFGDYIATVQHGALVWHLFEVDEP